jgi:integrase/recombinase XerD
MVDTIYIEHAIHNNRMKLFIKFEYDVQTIQLAKTLPGVKWSHSHKGWYIGYHNEAISLIKDTFTAKGIEVTILNELQAAEKKNPEAPVKPADLLPALTEDLFHKTVDFKEWLTSKRYSNNTITTYIDALSTFLRYCSFKPIVEITNDDLIKFNNQYIIANNFSSSFQNQVVNAVKLFFSKIENKKLAPDLIHRPKTQKLLPNVLSKEEIKLILNAHGNIKHKAMLSLIYSCGLRRGELLNLKLKDIDSKRGLIIVRQSKGRKDRIVPLSEKILKLLRNYYIAYKPKEWLFEGQQENSRYAENSLAHVLKQALEKSNIHKPVTLHWLRHSYATHLLENGTDLRYIQEILGHSRSTTTEIYTHVSNKSIQKVISPFDSL